MNNARMPFVLLLAGAALLSAAPAGHAATDLGALAPPGTTGSGCLGCTVFQQGESGPPIYEAPAAGVITSFQVRSGPTPHTADRVRLRAVRQNPDSSWSVTGESPDHQFIVPNAIHTFAARVAVQPGDKIGVRANYLGDSAIAFAGGPGDVTALALGDPTVGGGSFSAALGANQRMNLIARLEPDADGDGYGDESQDLCPGDPAHGGAACSGTLVGSDLEEPRNAGGGCGGGPPAPPCTAFQSALAGAQLTAPYDGVIVRWRVDSPTGSLAYRLRVLRPQGGGSHRAIATSDPIAAPAAEPLIRSAAARIRVQAGDVIGLSTPSGSNLPMWVAADAGGMRYLSPEPADGDSATSLPFAGGRELLMNADVERDADGDGYGDETQDACPTDAATHGACPAPPPAGGSGPGGTGSGGAGADTTAPRILSASLSRRAFRVDRRGPIAALSTHAATVDRRGPIAALSGHAATADRRGPIAVRARPARGTTLRLALSEAATLRATVRRLLPGRRVRGRCRPQTRRNRSARRCLHKLTVASFSRALPAGASSLRFSGKLRRRGRAYALPRGRYELVLSATDAAGNRSAPRALRFAVVR